MLPVVGVDEAGGEPWGREEQQGVDRRWSRGSEGVQEKRCWVCWVLHLYCYKLQLLQLASILPERTITIQNHHLKSLNPKVMMMKLLRIMAVRRWNVRKSWNHSICDTQLRDNLRKLEGCIESWCQKLFDKQRRAVGLGGSCKSLVTLVTRTSSNNLWFILFMSYAAFFLQRYKLDCWSRASVFWFWLFHTESLQGHSRLAISFRLSSDTRLQHPIYFGTWWDSLNPTILFLMWRTGCLVLLILAQGRCGHHCQRRHAPRPRCSWCCHRADLMKPQHPWKLGIMWYYYQGRDITDVPNTQALEWQILILVGFFDPRLKLELMCLVYKKHDKIPLVWCNFTSVLFFVVRMQSRVISKAVQISSMLLTEGVQRWLLPTLQNTAVIVWCEHVCLCQSLIWIRCNVAGPRACRRIKDDLAQLLMQEVGQMDLEMIWLIGGCIGSSRKQYHHNDL